MYLHRLNTGAIVALLWHPERSTYQNWKVFPAFSVFFPQLMAGSSCGTRVLGVVQLHFPWTLSLILLL